MTYEDFAALYLVFHEKKDDEMLQVVFQLLKVSPSHVSHHRNSEESDGTLPNLQSQSGKKVKKQDVFMKGDLVWMCRLL